jgi:aldehyde dehydrogenase (NAD+)
MSHTADIFDSMEYGPAPESAGEAEAWLDGHERRFGLFIGGEWRAAESRFESFNPATAEPLAEIAQAGATDVNDAVAAARAAQGAWAKRSGHERARYLYALARLVQRHARLLAVLETLDNGKPIRETRDIDIPLVARHLYYHAGWAQILPEEFPGHVPLGVAGQIVPWNFPLLMLAWKVAPALATGNTVVLKPAEQTSLTALLFAELCQRAGLPPGVVNIVTGDGAVGELIAAHPDIDKIAFTGSTEVGRAIRQATAGSGKKLSLELGGKSPFIVFDDSDLDSAVEGLVDAIWFNQGQVCCAGSRLLVQESIADAFLAKTRARMEKLLVGDPLQKGIDIGAIVSAEQLARIRDLVDIGKKEGGSVWQPQARVPQSGWFYPPTLISDVQPAATVAQEEIFGPVLAAMTFRTPSEAVALANNSRYGLAASLWSENINLALDIAPKLAAGTVWINATNLFDAACGFGGVRDSGFGREGGREGLQEYLRPAWQANMPASAPPPAPPSPRDPAAGAAPPLDRTAKLYIGGAQKRPDSGYSLPVTAPDGALLAEVGAGNRKDIREAVEAAQKAAGWSKASAHNRAQVLYYIGENLEARAAEFRDRLIAMTGATRAQAAREVRAAVARLFAAAAWADKYEGAVHQPPLRGIALALNEPIGVIGIACPDDAPLLAFVSLAAAALAMGNRVVAVPSERHPLAATDLYQVLDTSDLPGGALNIVTGARDELALTLAEHDDVDALWYFGPAEGSAAVERAAAGNLKRVWSDHGHARDWHAAAQGEGREVLRHAVAVKNVWAPYGE